MSTARMSVAHAPRALELFGVLLVSTGCSSPPPPRLPATSDSTVLDESAKGSGPASGRPDPSSPQATNDAETSDDLEVRRYKRAIEAAKEAPIRDDLWRIDPTRSPVLVATVLTESAYQRYSAYESVGEQKTAPAKFGAVWVTAVPELEDFCSTLEGNADERRLRLAQWLGLPPDREQWPAYVAEFKVRPTDLLRPCVDNEVDDSTCNPLPAQASRVAAAQGSNTEFDEAAYQQWYRAKLWADEGRPFTGLGYTYDWAPKEDGKNRKRPKGASEFILRPSAHYEISSLGTLDRYCSWSVPKAR